MIRIVPGYWATKTDANTLDTFQAYEQGYLGTFINNRPYFFNTTSEPTGKRELAFTVMRNLPVWR